MSSPAPNARAKPRRRRWLQFSLRGCVVLMVLAALLMGWWSYWHHRINRQRIALREVRQLQKRIVKESDKEIYDPITISYNQTPWWLRVGGEPTIPVTTVVRFDTYQPTSVRDRNLRMLPEFPYLAEVHVRGGDIGDQGLFWARPLRRLKLLDLSLSKIDDDDLRALSEMPVLRTLVLDESQINGSGIAHLAGQLPLEQLSLLKVPLQEEHVSHLNRLHSLRELKLESASLTRLHLHDLQFLHSADISLSAEQADVRIERLPRLERLGVSIDIATIRSLQLSELPSLTELELGIYGEWSQHLGGSQPGELIRQVAKFHRLHSLEINYGDLCDVEAHQLSRLPGLERLSLRHCSITDEGLRSFSRMKTLKSLSIDSKYVTADGIRHLAQLPQLESLDLTNADFHDDPGPAILQLRALRGLNLSDCWFPSVTLVQSPEADDCALSGISIYGARGGLLSTNTNIRIEGLRSVEWISVMDARRGEKELVFEHLPTLRSIDLRLSRGDKIKRFTLSNLPQLQLIEVTGNESYVPAETLAQLRDWQGLRTLTISGLQPLKESPR